MTFERSIYRKIPSYKGLLRVASKLLVPSISYGVQEVGHQTDRHSAVGRRFTIGGVGRQPLTDTNIECARKLSMPRWAKSVLTLLRSRFSAGDGMRPSNT